MDELQEAIRRAIDQTRSAARARPAAIRGSLVAIAADAQGFVEEARAALSDGAGGPTTERRLVVGALLVYALDIAWSICHMLRTEPVKTHMVTLTLWRPLLETWLRAAFFEVEATDYEVSAFRTAGTIPMRAWPSRPGNLVDLSPRLIAKLVAPTICPQEPALIAALADEVKDWHGFVHGGDIIVKLFDGGETFEPQVGPDAMALKVQRVVVIAFLSGMVGISLSSRERGDTELSPIAVALTTKIRDFQKRWPQHMFAASAVSDTSKVANSSK